MNNPYQVLGVSENATDEEIKRAYRALAQKYHPDKYVNNPLASLAEEKLKEINEAYTAINQQRKSGTSYTQGNQTYNSNYSGGGSSNSSYIEIRNLINQGRNDEVISMLDRMPNHDAEWFFLKGTAFYQKGWFDQAINHITNATRMDPNNIEYRTALSRITGQNQSYRNMQGGNSNDMCRCCAQLYCMDCCCESMGGDLIPCC
jgi:molecular chaperone DnaJ